MSELVGAGCGEAAAPDSAEGGLKRSREQGPSCRTVRLRQRAPGMSGVILLLRWSAQSQTVSWPEPRAGPLIRLAAAASAATAIVTLRTLPGVSERVPGQPPTSVGAWNLVIRPPSPPCWQSSVRCRTLPNGPWLPYSPCRSPPASKASWPSTTSPFRPQRPGRRTPAPAPGSRISAPALDAVVALDLVLAKGRITYEDGCSPVSQKDRHFIEDRNEAADAVLHSLADSILMLLRGHGLGRDRLAPGDGDLLPELGDLRAERDGLVECVLRGR